MSPKPPMLRRGWYGFALDELEKLARRQRFMTSDDLWDAIGDREPPNPTAIGAVMNEAISNKTIKPTGRITHSTRPSRRGGNIQIHESCLYIDSDSIDDYIQRRQDGGQTNLLGA